MSAGLAALQPNEDDITKLLMASAHVGTKNVDYQMKKYVYKTRSDNGVNVIDLHKTWEKMVLAARVLVAIENPKDITAVSGRVFGQRAVLKFASHVGASTLAGRFTPGTFTNQIQKAFMEPRVLVVTDPRQDHQPVRESSYVNIPTIALCNTDTPLRYIDIAIPCNNTGVQSIGVMRWFLAREVLRMRGTIMRSQPWDVMPDLYFYRDPEEVEKEEQERAQAALEAAAVETTAAPAFGESALGYEAAPEVAAAAVAPVEGADWTAAAPAATPAAAAFAAAPADEQWGGAAGAQDWQAATGDWTK